MAKRSNELKSFNMRMPKEMWLFLKKTSASQEISMTELILRCVERYKKKFDSRLTDDDTNV
jgi:predicted HicB family RNase H-like nuclease